MTPKLFQAADNNQLDLFTALESTLNRSKYRFHLIAEEKNILVVPRSHPLNQAYGNCQIPLIPGERCQLDYNRATALPLSIFKEEKFMFSSPSQDLNIFSQTIFSNAGCTPNVILTTKNIESLYAMTLAGLGLSFIPSTYITHANLKNHAVYYLLDDPSITRRFGIAYRKNHPPSNVSGKFISLLKKQFR